MRGISGKADLRATRRAPLGKPSHGPIRTMALTEKAIPPLSFAVQRGLYQDNGASPWYALIGVGSPPQTLKLALDTGSNFIWAMSNLCDNCGGTGRTLFNPSASTTFSQVTPLSYDLSYGPWGSLTANLGADDLALPNGAPFGTPLYVSTHLDDKGGNFKELDWDGGIGLPSIPGTADPNVPCLFEQLMNSGMVDPGVPIMSFCYDAPSKTGQVILGGCDTSKFDPNTGLFLPFTPYTALSGEVEYIWTTPMARFSMGNNVEIDNGIFSLDTGSSCFKGDPPSMSLCYENGLTPNGPPVNITLQGQSLIITPDLYRVTIEAGNNQGQTLPQFTQMALPGGFVLVGSIVLDNVYTIYEYDVTVAPMGTRNWYYLYPKGMWIFNKTSGSSLVQGKRAKPKTFERKKSLVIA